MDTLDWSAIRGTIDLAMVATRELGPAARQRGAVGLWWKCPFHDDRNPSFQVRLREQRWNCFGCGANGDAVGLVRQLHPEFGFREAVAYLTDSRAPTTPVSRPAPPAVPNEPSGLPARDAMALVQEAQELLWMPAADGALEHLRRRGLRDETIRAHRLGFTEGVSFPTRAGGTARAVGIVVPWLDGNGVALVKVRQNGREPRYAEVHRDPVRLNCYPHLSAIRPGLPLVIVEGELDALLLGQELAGLASVVTIGSASSKPAGTVLSAALQSPRWYSAHDSDGAGDEAAARWGRAVRIRPPGHFKDWSECVQVPRYPVGLRRWWTEVLSGNHSPSLYTWDELTSWRWAGADNGPGITISPSSDENVNLAEYSRTDHTHNRGVFAP